jgi:hypothetical protein
MPRILRGAIFLAVLGVLLGLVLPRGLADLHGFEAREAYKAWEARRRAPTDEEWTSARDLLRDAQALDPGHPAYREDIARLHELRAAPLKPGDALAQDDLRAALGNQRQAARLRPSSPYTWASIARLKSRLAEPDREFEAALRNAALLGPWEPSVQLALADIGFRHWRTLAPETRTALSNNAQRTLRRHDARLFDIARRHGRLDALCAVRGVERSRLARACI